jgi:polysaccharide pyruvyl transferase CsaB
MIQNKVILIAGSYGMGNTGDEAILAAILDQLRARVPNAIIQVVAGDVQYIRAQFSVETVPWDDWSAIVQAVKRSDLIIQGGGGLFFDYWGFDPKSLLQNTAPDLAHFGGFSLLAGLFHKPFMLYACGVGPLFTDEGREMVRLVFSLAHCATVRDAESKALLEEIGMDGARVLVTADPAFSLQMADPQRVDAILAQSQINPGLPLICVAPRPWEFGISQSTWEKQLAQNLALFASKKAAQILLIPFHKGYDDATIQRIQAQLPADTVRVLGNGYSVSEIASVIGRSNLLVGMRLHSLLFAILTGTPAVALAYDPKVRNLARRIGHEEICLDLEDLTNLESHMTRVWERRDELQKDFLTVGSGLKSLALQNADLSCSLLNGPVPDLACSNTAFRQTLSRVVEGRLKEIQTGEEAHQVEVQSLRSQINELQRELDTIHQTKFWRVAHLFWRIRGQILK